MKRGIQTNESRSSFSATECFPFPTKGWPVFLLQRQWRSEENPVYPSEKILGKDWIYSILGGPPLQTPGASLCLRKTQMTFLRKFPKEQERVSNDRWPKEIRSSQRKAEKDLFITGEVDIAKVIELKLCPLVHKGRWGKISEADGNFPNGDGGNLKQIIANVLASQALEDFEFLGDCAIPLPHRSVSKFWSKKRMKWK